jgi:RimJ/RimL family protein N-acetyltransferase
MLLETPRLTIRAFRPEDAPRLSQYRSDPQIARYQAWEAPYTLEQAIERIATYTKDPDEPGWFQYAVELKATGQQIGDVGVELHINLMQADLGFTLAPGNHGHGYALEMTTAILGDRFRRGLHRMSAQADARNHRSAHLLARLGFAPEGLRPSYQWAKGEWADEALYGLLAENWQPPVSLTL